VRVVIAEVPVRLSVPVDHWVSQPVPARAVETVRVALLVTVTPVIVTLGIEMAEVHPILWLLVLKVWIPVFAVNVVPLWVRPQRKVGIAAAVAFQTPPLLMVTAQTKVLAPVAEVSVRVSVIEVVPVTVTVWAQRERIPSVIVRLPPIVVVPDEESVPAVLFTVTWL
jgi:hypothetical protein